MAMTRAGESVKRPRQLEADRRIDLQFRQGNNQPAVAFR